MSESGHLLRLGALVMSDGEDPAPAPAGAEYWFAVEGEDFTTGDAEPIERTLRTLLQDGTVTVTDGLENRTGSFRVIVKAHDALALAHGEAALAGELGKANTLAWTPPDASWGPTSVFEVFTSSMALVHDDLAEVLELERTYVVRLVCHPSVRSVDLIETPAIVAPPVAPVTTTINAGNSLPGWSVPFATLVDSGDYLTVKDTKTPRIQYTAPSPVDLSATPYVMLDMSQETTPSFGHQSLAKPPILLVDGVYADLVAGFRVAGESTPKVRYVWKVAAASATRFLFGTDFDSYGYRLNVKLLQATNQPPSSGTTRQKLRTVKVEGSARTQGSLVIEHETAALGSVLAYTWPQTDRPYEPPLRRYLTTGTPFNNAGGVSGFGNNTDELTTFDVPVSAIIPGTHLLMARMKCETVGAWKTDWTMQVVVDGVPVGPVLSGRNTHSFGSNLPRNVILTRQVLPTLDMPDGSDAVVRLTLVNPVPPEANVEVDEVWLFNTTVGALTWVECGTGSPSPTASNRLWISTPTTARPRPQILRGTDPNASNAYSASSAIYSFGRHEFTPPAMNVLTVTAGAQDAAVSLSHYPRWHSHAAL